MRQAAEEAIPTLVDAMERYGRLQLEAEVRRRLLAMSAATMDRLLTPVRQAGKQGRRRSHLNTALRKSIAVRTFNDWNDPPPGCFEMDMVAHCGKSVAGRHVHSLVLTDIASGSTEAAAMVVRERTEGMDIRDVDAGRFGAPFCRSKAFGWTVWASHFWTAPSSPFDISALLLQPPLINGYDRSDLEPARRFGRYGTAKIRTNAGRESRYRVLLC